MTISRRQDEETRIGNGAPAHKAPARHRHGEHFCRCPQCDYEISVEEGQKCNLIECPRCGSRMRGK